MCSFHFKFSYIYVPKSLKTLNVGILVLLTNRLFGSNGLIFLIFRAEHFLKFIRVFLILVIYRYYRE